jgi:KUP system potassium uptake protein
MTIASSDGTHSHTSSASLRSLMLGAIGVVFGDIGTSPLYTIKEAFTPHYGLTPDHATVLGILSLVFWSLMVIITVKYVAVIMRADNEGEGGIMALTALAQRTPAQRVEGGLRHRPPRRVRRCPVLWRRRADAGDLGAVRGRRPGGRRAGAARWILPITIGVLLMLFATQRFGTDWSARPSVR